MKFFPRSAAFVLCLSLLPWALFPQEYLPDFSSIDNNLEKLESLITDTLNNSETLNQQLADLNLALSESELSLQEQEALLKELRTQVNEQPYRTLSLLSKKYETSSKFWRNFTLIGIPAAVVISALTVGLAVGLR
jgi:septal ring factor EnvC (AmiA/AmiB activator)